MTYNLGLSDVQTQIVAEDNTAANGEAGGINGHAQAISSIHKR